jgi:GT2 family glycosyltransferase
VQELCKRFESMLAVEYRHYPQPGKGRSIQWVVEQLREGFVLFLDDDVRVCEDLLERYADSVQRHGRGHFFGGPLNTDYEVEPVAWLKRHLPKSVTGWTAKNPSVPLHGKDRFLGANFGAFAEDVLEVGGFLPQIGPGAFQAGTPGNPTGLELELQDRMLGRGYIPIYVEGAVVWHFVPRERCSESWALHRIFRNEFSRTLRLEAHQPARGRRLWRVPVRVWLRFMQAVVLAALGPLHPDAHRRFRWSSGLHKVRGRIRGYRSGGVG